MKASDEAINDENPQSRGNSAGTGRLGDVPAQGGRRLAALVGDPVQGQPVGIVEPHRKAPASGSDVSIGARH